MQHIVDATFYLCIILRMQHIVYEAVQSMIKIFPYVAVVDFGLHYLELYLCFGSKNPGVFVMKALAFNCCIFV